MSAKSVITALTGFLAHHIGDLNNVAGILSELNSAVPLDAQDKGRIQEAIDAVKASANNINDFLSGNTVTGGDVTVRESDIVEALGNFFASDAGKAALASAVGNGSNSNG